MIKKCVTNFNELRLTDEQQVIVSHKDSVDVWHVVNGAGGTGKSVAILKKAINYLDEDENCKVLYIVGKTVKLKQMIDSWTNGFAGKYGNRIKIERSDIFWRECGFDDAEQDGKLPIKEDSILLCGVSTKESEDEINKFKNKLDECIKDKKYDHVFVDEAQDLKSRVLYLFSKMAQKSFTLVGSKKQFLFARSDEAWKELLDYVAKAYNPKKKIETSYLNIQQRICNPNIVKTANNISGYSNKKKNISKGEFCEELDKNVEGLSNDKPRVIICKDKESEYKALIREINNHPAPENGREWCIGVLRVSNKDVEDTEKAFEKECNERWCNKIYTRNENIYTEKVDQNGGVVFLTVANSKGLDFDIVFIFYEDYLSCTTRSSDRNNLYVAVTRARNALTVLVDGNNYNNKISSVLGDGCEYLKDDI